MVRPVLNTNLLLQFSDDIFKVISRTMKVGQGTAQELVAEEESNSRNIDSLVQEPHRKGVPETMEGDVLVDACRFNYTRHLLVQDTR